MNAGEKRIVITGLGPVTPLGTGLDPLWNGLAAGKSGVMKLQAFDADNVGTQIAAEVRDFDPKQYVKQRKSLKVMARDIQLAVGAAELAVQDSKLDPTQLDATRFGVNFGAGLIATELEELGGPVEYSTNGSNKFDLKKWGASGMEQLFPLWMLKYLPNMPACHISIIYNAQGPNNSITAGEASAMLAAGEAYRVIARGQADVFIAGCTDSKIHPLSIVRYGLINRLSKHWDDPAKASRPFDSRRDGVVPGEGAGVMILEEAEHAKARRAKIYGEILGFGASAQPKKRVLAMVKAIQRALIDAKLQTSDLGHVIASGVSCQDEDRDELKALAEVFGENSKIPIVGYKSYLGHLAAGGGTVELIASLLGSRHGVLVPTLNYESPDADAPKLNILREKIEFPDKPFLKLDLSLGGQCGALVVRPLAG
jgi:3-oxoacyl-[acyl-carrier-protein] synthase II